MHKLEFKMTATLYRENKKWFRGGNFSFSRLNETSTDGRYKRRIFLENVTGNVVPGVTAKKRLRELNLNRFMRWLIRRPSFYETADDSLNKIRRRFSEKMIL